MKAIKLLTLSILLGAGLGAHAQHNLHTSQYMNNWAFVNPAAIGSFTSLQAGFFFKNQWAGFDGAPTMQGLTISKPSKDLKMAFGGELYHDKIGVNNVYNLGGTYAYKIQLKGGQRVSFGLTGYLNMQQSEFAEVQTIVDNDPVYMANTKMVVMPNFRFGTYMYTPEYFVGFAIPNLMKNNVVVNGEAQGQTSFDTQDMHFFLHGGYNMELSRDVMFSPSLLIKHVSGTPVQLDFNLNATFLEKVGIGMSYRTSQEIVMMANYIIDEKLMIGYSYDLGFSDLSLFSNGSHEVMLRFKVRTSYREEAKPKVESEGSGSGGRIEI